jgi:hypothetical protein
LRTSIALKIWRFGTSSQYFATDNIGLRSFWPFRRQKSDNATAIACRISLIRLGMLEDMMNRASTAQGTVELSLLCTGTYLPGKSMREIAPGRAWILNSGHPSPKSWTDTLRAFLLAVKRGPFRIRFVPLPRRARDWLFACGTHPECRARGVCCSHLFRDSGMQHSKSFFSSQSYAS